MFRKEGGRGLKSVENEYKNSKVKAAVKLYCNSDPTMAAVRSFEELSVQKEHCIVKDAKKYDELNLQLLLSFPNPTTTADDKEFEAKKAKEVIYKAHQQQTKATVEEERWQGKLIANKCVEGDDTYGELLCMAFLLEERTDAHNRTNSRTLPTTFTH